MPKRSDDKRSTAKAEYLARRSKGEKVNLRELSERVGVTYQTLRNWKSAGHWDDELPKKARGGQPRNKNSAGKKNAAGSHKGAPPRNKNAEKDGAYSKVFFDMLSDAERDLMEKAPLESRAALEHEMKVLKFREHKILSKIAEYEAALEDTFFTSSILDMRTPAKGQDGAEQAMKLQEALYKVQGRIAKVADSLRALEENEKRLALEAQRLEILRMRATGAVDVGAPDENKGENTS